LNAKAHRESNHTTQLRRWIDILGSKTIFFLLGGVSLGSVAGMLEAGVALVIQLFLKSLGMIPPAVEIPYLHQLNLSLISVLILLAGIICTKAGVTFLGTQMVSFASERFNCSLKNLAAFEFLEGKTNSKTSTSDLFFRFQEVIPKTVGTLIMLSQLVSTLVQLLFLYLAMLFLLPKEALLATVGIVVLGIAVDLLSRKIRPISQSVTSESRCYTREIQSAIPNILFFRVMRMTMTEYNRLADRMARLSGAVVYSSAVSGLVSALPAAFGTILVCIVIYVSHEIWGNVGPALLSFLYLLLRFVQYLATMTSSFASFRVYSAQCETAFEFVRKIPEASFQRWRSCHVNDFNLMGRLTKSYDINSKINKIDNGTQPSGVLCTPSVQVEGISFKYPESDKFVIKDLRMSIPKGEHIGIVGRSGAGKSTLLRLLMGLEKPTHGRICFDGMDPEVYFSQGENRIGYVGVEPFLFHGTLRENLKYGIQIEVTDRQIKEAVKLAQLSDFVDEVGLDYVISEDLSGLSAGQKQRLCLARALLNNPTVLVLDEATANLDERTEISIAEDLRSLKGKLTTFIVAHRREILRHVDQLIPLD